MDWHKVAHQRKGFQQLQQWFPQVVKRWWEFQMWERIRYDVPAPHIARITLARADRRNAQDYQMLYELDAAFQAATLDASARSASTTSRTDGRSARSGRMSADTCRLERISVRGLVIRPFS